MDRRRFDTITKTLPAQPGALALFAWGADLDGLLRVDALPAIAIEIERGAGDGWQRTVRAVADTGEVAGHDLMTAIEFSTSRVIDYCGAVHASRDAWLSSLAKQLEDHEPQHLDPLLAPPEARVHAHACTAADGAPAADARHVHLGNHGRGRRELPPLRPA